MSGNARLQAILALCPRDRLVIDVGADHGKVAAALGGIATERALRPGRHPGAPWVVADGLKPFRAVPAAVIAGMGALRILRILDAGPRPEVAVLHAPDDPPALRCGLARAGWRIDAERLAPEAGRWAEVIRATPGAEPAEGLWLHYGPRLLAGDDPHLRAHLQHLRRWADGLASRTRDAAPARSARFRQHAAFLAARLAERGWTAG